MAKKVAKRTTSESYAPGTGTLAMAEDVMGQMDAKAQNDIADALLWLANLLPGGAIKDFVLQLAKWFEDLSQNEEVQSQLAEHGVYVDAQFLESQCAKEIADEIRGIVYGMGMAALAQLPQLLEKFLNCLIGRTESVEAEAAPKLQLNFNCVISAAFTYFRTRNIEQTISAFLTCQFGSGGGGGGGGSGLGNPIFRDINPC